MNQNNQVIGNTTSVSAEDFDKWLEKFYSECGREVTLAYTTLNQMKNWSMVIVGAFVTIVVGFSKPEFTNTDNKLFVINTVVFTGAVIAYVFSLRFYVRAILCYINLTRWNKLQSDIVSYKIVSMGSASQQTLKEALIKDIKDYYHQWSSPIDRKTQIISNLKLGFALLLGLPLFIIIIGTFQLWTDYFIRGLLVFALGNSLLEINDFYKSSFFDTPESRLRRKKQNGLISKIFPIPTSRSGYIISWLIIITLSIMTASWPQLYSFVIKLMCFS